MAAGEFIDLPVAREQHERLLRGMNRDFTRLKEDPEAWAAFETETAAWDTTSDDHPAGTEAA